MLGAMFWVQSVCCLGLKDSHLVKAAVYLFSDGEKNLFMLNFGWFVTGMICGSYIIWEITTVDVKISPSTGLPQAGLLDYWM